MHPSTVTRGPVLFVTLNTFGAVTLTWVFFRADTFTDAWDYLTGIATLRSGPVERTAVWIVIPALVVALVVDLAQRRAAHHEAIMSWPRLVRGFAYGAAAIAFVVFSGDAPVPFLYFQF